MNKNILHKFSRLAIASLAVVSLWSCHDGFEDKGIPELVVAPSSKEIIFAEAGTQVVKVETNRDWKAFLETPVDWLELSKTSGSGDDVITLTAAAGAREQSAKLVIALYNQYGIMMSETISITRHGDGSPVYWFEFDWASALTSSWQNDVTVHANDVDWYITGMNTSTYGNIGFSYFNNDGGYIYNKTAIGETITEIVVDLQSEEDASKVAIFAGDAEHPATPEQEIKGVLAGDRMTYSIPTGTPYFTLKNVTNGYLNIDGFEVSYDGAIVGGGSTENPDGGDAGEVKELFYLDDAALGITAALVNASATSTVNEIGFEASNIGYAAAFGTMYIDRETAGYIRNTTPLTDGIVSVTVKGGYSIATDLVVMVGESADAVTEVVPYSSTSGSSWDTLVVYTLPASAKFIKFVAKSEGTADAALSRIAFNVNE